MIRPGRDPSDGHDRMWSLVFWVRHAAIVAFGLAFLGVPGVSGRTGAVVACLFGVLPYNVALHLYLGRTGRLPRLMAFVDPFVMPAFGLIFPELWVAAIAAAVGNLALLALTFDRLTSAASAALSVVVFAGGAVLTRTAEHPLDVVSVAIVCPLLALVLGAFSERDRSVQRRYFDLIHGVDAIVWEAEPWATSPTFVSRGTGDIVGYPAAQWLSDPGLWRKVVHRDDVAALVAARTTAMTEGIDQQIEYRAIHSDGRTVWLRELVRPTTGPDGRVTKIRGVTVEVTDRRIAEAAFAEALERLGTVVANAPITIFAIDADGVFTLAEGQGLLDMGLQSEAIVGRSMYDVAGDLREPVEFGRRALNGESFTGVVRFRGRTLQAWYGPLRDEAGGVRGAMCVITDVTERARAEAKLRESEQRYRELFENANDVVYTLDMDGVLSSLNKAGERLFGYTRDEVLGTRIRNILAPEYREGLRAMLDRKLAGEAETRYEAEIVHRDGRRIPVEVSTRLVFDNGAAVGVQGIARDITERKRAEEVLRQSVERLQALDTMKNTFLEAVSHELRTPLTSILGFTATLERDELERDPPLRHEIVRRMGAKTRKLQELLADLLDLDRLRRGIVAPQLRTTDIADLIRRVVGDLELPDGHAVTVESQPCTGQVDAPKVERIVENLVANAVRHTPPGTPIWIRNRTDDGGVLIEVEDAGPGIPPELRETVFEPFRRMSISAHAPGVGIGLSLVARFAELHGGRAWVEQREGGGGAVFRVFLPTP